MTGRRLVDADLTVRFDDSVATVHGAGDRVTVRTDRPAALFAAVRRSRPVGSRLRTAAPALAQLLDDAGLTVEVVGLDRTVLSIGRGQHSRVGRLLTGSTLIAPGLTGAIRAVLTRETRTWLRQRRMPRRTGGRA